MPTLENIRRFSTSDRICVLTLTALMPNDLDDAQTAFYTPLYESFARAVKERLFPLALDAYRECSDRRKRWRYTPWQAHFCLTREGKTLILCLSACETVHLKQAHTWKGGVITRRKKLG